MLLLYNFASRCVKFTFAITTWTIFYSSILQMRAFNSVCMCFMFGLGSYPKELGNLKIRCVSKQIIFFQIFKFLNEWKSIINSIGPQLLISQQTMMTPAWRCLGLWPCGWSWSLRHCQLPHSVFKQGSQFHSLILQQWNTLHDFSS